MKIRNLEERDIPAVERLYRQFWGEWSNLESMKKRFTALARNEDYLFLVAEMDGTVAGTIMGIVCHELYGECRPFLLMEDLVVDGRFRKKGIGRALLLHLEEKAKTRDCYQILFMTEKDRADTVRFYESLGFDSAKNIGFKKSFS